MPALPHVSLPETLPVTGQVLGSLGGVAGGGKDLSVTEKPALDQRQELSFQKNSVKYETFVLSFL